MIRKAINESARYESGLCRQMAIESTDMNQEQIDEFLKASRHGVLATNRIDGPPQVTAVWYLYEDKKIYITIFANSVKYRTLKRDPRVGICIDGGHPDARAVTIYGNAELMEGDSIWRNEIMFRITRRYTESDEEAFDYNKQAASDGEEVLVIVTPAKIFARDYN